MKRILMLVAIIVALGAAAAVFQNIFSPLVALACPVAPPP
jgi:hypothetical protein